MYKDRDTQLEAQRQAYRDNPEPYFARQAERREVARQHIWSIKENSKCKKCGQGHPAALDFHHRNPSEKEVSAVKMVSNKYSTSRIDKELSKCDVLCSNCHRILHYELEH